MESIGSFAENLILNEVSDISEGKALPTKAQGQDGVAPAGKDISNVEVPDAFMREILGESFHPQESSPASEMPELVWAEEEPQVPSTPELISEDTARSLVPLLEEVRDLLKEMTTCGSIGVNMAGPQASKETEPLGVDRKSILKQSIRNKLKKRSK